jgi:hypothetical protein
MFCLFFMSCSSKIVLTGELTKSCLVDGMGGTGKTTQLVLEIKNALKSKKKIAVLAYTCASCRNIKCSIIASDTIMTFNRFFLDDHSNRSHVEKAANKDIIFIDEFSMAPKRFFFILFQAKQLNPDLVIRIFGDHDQCTPMENDWIDYMESQLFRSLVDHTRMTLPYQEGSCRYDKPLYVSLVHLLDTGTLREALDERARRQEGEGTE